MRISDVDRRRRLVHRHRLARDATNALDATRAVAALHSSDPATPYLGLWARVVDFTVADLDAELLERRRLWRMHAMRRTLFVVPTEDLWLFEGGAAREVARRERRRLIRWLHDSADVGDLEGWLTAARQDVLAALGTSELSTREITEGVPELQREVVLGSGTWMRRAPIASRLLFLMAMHGDIVRTRTAGSWRASQYRWARAEHWRGDMLTPADEPAARAALAERYLAAYGPVTMTDLRWWSGWTVAAARGALAQLEVAEVDLDSSEAGWILAEDLDSPPPRTSTVALLPALDPTPMGWKSRAWYLGGHEDALFDRNGNVGPTVWVDGAVVGGWGQRPDGVVDFRILEEVDATVGTAVADEATRLTAWLDGVVASPRFPTPLGRELSNRSGDARRFR